MQSIKLLASMRNILYIAVSYIKTDHNTVVRFMVNLCG